MPEPDPQDAAGGESAEEGGWAWHRLCQGPGVGSVRWWSGSGTEELGVAGEQAWHRGHWAGRGGAMDAEMRLISGVLSHVYVTHVLLVCWPSLSPSLADREARGSARNGHGAQVQIPCGLPLSTPPSQRAVPPCPTWGLDLRVSRRFCFLRQTIVKPRCSKSGLGTSTWCYSLTTEVEAAF